MKILALQKIYFQKILAIFHHVFKYQENTVAYEKEFGRFEIRAVYPDYLTIENINLLSGRLINQPDVIECREVAVISTDIRDVIFKNKNPIGKYLKLVDFQC